MALLLCQVLLSCSFGDGPLTPGFPLHAPGKLFGIPEVFGIRSALVQSPEKFEKTVRVETPATKFINNRESSGLEFF
jgi:hypothetical protein